MPVSPEHARRVLAHLEGQGSMHVSKLERDRELIRHAALKIIRLVIEQPSFKVGADARRGWMAPPKLETFRRLEPLGFNLEQDDFWIFHPKDCAPDLIWPLDVGIICDRAGEDQHLRLQRTYTVTAQQVRGYASRFSPFMTRIDAAMVDRGKLVSSSHLYAYLGGQWTTAETRTLWSGRNADEATPERSHVTDPRDADQPRLAASIGLRQRYEWAVALGLEHSPTIRFATDATGIKEVFRVRDLPEGRDRRAALMTWISDHWRQDRKDADVEVYVRKHLRGSVSFNWRGLVAEILPSQFDIEQRDRLIAEREAMRASGSDKRARAVGVSQ
jgi:hypothetical protein